MAKKTTVQKRSSFPFWLFVKIPDSSSSLQQYLELNVLLTFSLAKKCDLRPL
jgi:hypothetical protein